jgi:hypothetical protein
LDRHVDATCKHVGVEWMKQLIRSGDVVFPVVMLVIVAQSLYYGLGALNDWPILTLIGSLWYVSARQSQQPHATSHSAMTDKTPRMRALDLAWLAFGTVIAVGFGKSSVQSGGWPSQVLAAALALVVIVGLVRYVREIVQSRWQQP